METYPPRCLFLVAQSIHKIDFETLGAFEVSDDTFTFRAKSISTDEICEPMMDILLEQAINQPLLFRHRHPAGNDDKVIPVFGRISKASKISENGKVFMSCEYRVMLKTKAKHEIPHNKTFADWVKESYEAKNPIGISLQFLKYMDSGKAYWVDFLEASGTHDPACKECRNIKLEGGTMPDNGQEEQKKKYQDLEAELERITKERTKLELDNKGLGDEKTTLKAALEKAQADGKSIAEGFVKLKNEFQVIREQLDYEQTKGPLVKRIITLESRPELESFYKGQKQEYLEATIKALETPRPAINASKEDFMVKFNENLKKTLETNPNPPTDEVLKGVDPTLRSALGEFLKKGGG